MSRRQEGGGAVLSVIRLVMATWNKQANGHYHIVLANAAPVLLNILGPPGGGTGHLLLLQLLKQNMAFDMNTPDILN